MLIGGFGSAIGISVTPMACITSTDTTLAIAIIGFTITGLFFGPIFPAALSYAGLFAGYAGGDTVPVVNAAQVIATFGLSPIFFGNIINSIGYKSSFFIQAVIFMIGGVLGICISRELKINNDVTILDGKPSHLIQQFAKQHLQHILGNNNNNNNHNNNNSQSASISLPPTSTSSQPNQVQQQQAEDEESLVVQNEILNDESKTVVSV
jgi:MFS family permease